MSKRKHVTLSISQKAEILEKLKNGASGRRLAEQYGIGASTVWDIKKSGEKIESFMKNRHLSSRKTMKKAEHPEMEKELYSWFTHERNLGTPISFEMLKEEARKLFHKHYGKDTFVASRGWLINFKKRHGLNLEPTVRRNSEELLKEEPNTASFITKLSKLIEANKLMPSQIYNAHRCRLYCKTLPENTVHSGQEALEEGLNKDYVTFLVCTNGNGTHKVKLLVIGKLEHSKKIKIEDISVEYMFDTNPMITSDLLQEWFHNSFTKQVKMFLKSQNLSEKALLLINSVSNDSSEVDLVSEDGLIFTLVLPKNCPKLLRPIEEISATLTNTYYKNLIAYAESLENDTNNIHSRIQDININDSIILLNNAWREISIRSLGKNWEDIISGRCDSREECDDKQNNSEEDISMTIVKEEPFLNEDYKWTKNENINEEIAYNNNSDTKQIVPPNTKIKHEQAVECFALGLQWAEENIVHPEYVKSLRELREQAIIKATSQPQTNTL